MNYANDIVKTALKEDVAKKDITTELVVPRDSYVKAALFAKENCVVCGLPVAASVFRAVDKHIKFKPAVSEGQNIKKGKIIARLSGRAQSILTAERVALNFITLLSGIATKTKAYVNAVKSYKVNPVRNNKAIKGKISNGVKIVDTRKTMPGLRSLEKYAVRIGGGFNHRFSLDEMILVKDNHLKVVGGYKGLKGKEKILSAKRYQVELEVKNLKEFKEALAYRPNIIMLDNMSIKDIKRAVEIRNRLSPPAGRAGTIDYPLPDGRQGLSTKLEVSGGISLKNIRKIAACGVDMISIGDLTHSVKSIDMSLEIL